MELPEIKEFFDYQPIFDAHPQFLVDQIVEQASVYLRAEQLAHIQAAYEFAHRSHEQVLRLSGEPYIVHPLRATLFLMDLKPDLETIQTCILHDVIEDTDVTYEEIDAAFGKEVADLCEGLVKVSKVRYTGEDRQLETLKKTFLAMGKDLRVIFVKLADRIHNIQTLHYHPKPEKRERIAVETLKVFVPIAKKLGLFHFQTYLENGSFKILHPEAFEEIVGQIKKNFGSDLYVEKGIKNLTKIMYKGGLKDFDVKGRLKSPYRIYEKMHKKYQKTDFSKILDVLAFRVITKDIAECYQALGIIHKSYTPLINKIKDYIAVPKFNGYKSIHTTILGMFKFPVEIQIRTEQMNEIAEYGVAAHFAYSEHHGPTLVSQQQSDWIKKLQELVDTYQNLEDKEHFKDELNIEVLHKEMFLYTPKGDIIEMPQGSTVLDFAFRIHSDVGLRFKNALVNGIIKPIGYRPETGDVIEIITTKQTITASKYWVDFLNTPSARSRLARYFHQLEKEEIVKQGTSRLNEKLKEYGLPLINNDKDLISKDLKGYELENMLIKINDGQLSRTKIIRHYYPKELKQREEAKLKTASNSLPRSITPHKVSHIIAIDTYKTSEYHICPECNPQLTDTIIAKSDRHGIKIHAISCKALSTISMDKLLEAHRDGQEVSTYILSMQFSVKNRPGIISRMILTFQDLYIALENISIDTMNDGTINISIQSIFQNPSKIAYLLRVLKQNEQIIKITKRVLS